MGVSGSNAEKRNTSSLRRYTQQQQKKNYIDFTLKLRARYLTLENGASELKTYRLCLNEPSDKIRLLFLYTNSHPATGSTNPWGSFPKKIKSNSKTKPRDFSQVSVSLCFHQTPTRSWYKTVVAVFPFLPRDLYYNNWSQEKPPVSRIVS